MGGVAVVVGWLALGVAVGNWLVRWRRMAPATATFVGTLLALAALELLGALPLIGDLLALAVATAGLGAVVLTRFGTQVFIPDSPALLVHG
ncbi:MAG: hypothetical protein HC828_02765 [Blastochloris sp.]|nr:hypothetical protein [Blastochloris sp.]